MATISKREYEALNTMFRVQEFSGASHTRGVLKGKWYIDTRGMSPAELIKMAKKSVPSFWLSGYEHGDIIPQCPFGPHRLYNLAVEEFIRRYSAYGREWMRAGSVEEADV